MTNNPAELYRALKAAHGRKKKRNKYRAIRSEVDGIHFDSLREQREYHELKIRERAHEISHLVIHPKFKLIVNDILVRTYTADFQYIDHLCAPPRFRVVDIKSPQTAKTQDFRMVRKLMQAIYQIEIEVKL